MSDSIPLSQEHGLRPVIAVCPNCGGKSSEIVLVGNGRVYTCSNCETNQIGYKRPESCPNCGLNQMTFRATGGHRLLFTAKPYDESMPIIGGLCSECEKERDEHAAAVAEGGVYWECEDCPAHGVIKASSPFAAAVREQHGIEAPEPCGVRFVSGHEPACPHCGGHGDKKEA